jgi:hypothetical protein
MWQTKFLQWTSCRHQDLRKTKANFDSKCQVQYECLTPLAWTELKQLIQRFKHNDNYTYHIVQHLKNLQCSHTTYSMYFKTAKLNIIDHFPRRYRLISPWNTYAASFLWGEFHHETDHEWPVGEQRYSSTLFEPYYKMSVGDQCHTLAALPSGMWRWVHWHLSVKDKG